MGHFLRELITRREAVRLLGSASAAAWLAPVFAKSTSTPRLAAGSPMSRERLALIEAFKRNSEGLQDKFEARTHKGDWTMPYRLFRPTASARLPLVVYLHGSGGQGDDNEKQLKLGNIFGTRVWLLPENQKMLPGLGQGTGMVLEVIEQLRREFPIDSQRISVTGQSMGGAGSWNIVTNRPGFFAPAAICCGSRSPEDGTGSIETPVWNFHGEADQAVPVSLSRDRIAARRNAGGHPLSTEYAGVDHNAWEWAFTEQELVKWMFAQRLE